MKVLRVLAFMSLVAAFAGCYSYDIVQSNIFSGEDGRVVQVEYGRSKSDHVNKFQSPVTGKTMDFKSKLLVKVHLPEGDDFLAWQCMNFTSSGTMYRSDNDKWMFHANGFSCAVYRRDESDPSRYLEVFRGVLCDTSNVDRRRRDKWREMKKDAGGNWR